MNLLSKLYTVGAIDISGIYLTGKEAMEKINLDFEHLVTITTSVPIGMQAVNKNLFMPREYISSEDQFRRLFDATIMFVVYSTRNLAENVDYTQVLAIMQCICDTQDLAIKV